MGCSGVAATFGVLLVMGQLWLAVHGGRPGLLLTSGCSLQSIPDLSSSSSPGRGTRKLSDVFKEVFERPRPLDPQEGGGGVDVVGWDLRKVPSGPDPLHHHNGGPRKPETP